MRGEGCHILHIVIFTWTGHSVPRYIWAYKSVGPIYVGGNGRFAYASLQLCTCWWLA